MKTCAKNFALSESSMAEVLLVAALTQFSSIHEFAHLVGVLSRSKFPYQTAIDLLNVDVSDIKNYDVFLSEDGFAPLSWAGG